jgi:hypothetical protein
MPVTNADGASTKTLEAPAEASSLEGNDHGSVTGSRVYESLYSGTTIIKAWRTSTSLSA